MGKYVYMIFIKWAETTAETSREDHYQMMFPRLGELCTKHDVELLTAGFPVGPPEDVVFIFETDLPLDEFLEFRLKFLKLGEQKPWIHTKTIPILKF